MPPRNLRFGRQVRQCPRGHHVLLWLDKLHALVELALLARVVHTDGTIVSHDPRPDLARLTLVVGKLHAVNDNAVGLFSVDHCLFLNH